MVAAMLRQVPRFAKATPAHAAEVAASLRSSDRRELSVIGIRNHAERLAQIITIDGDARAVLDAEGRAVALFGCAANEHGGAPWMLCATGINRARRLIVKHGERWVRAWARKWGQLRNASFSENKLHHRFIEKCGFSWVGMTTINNQQFRVFEYV